MKELEQYTDKEIIEKILDGQVPLFEILIRRNNPFLYKVGRSYNFNLEDTQDLMQDTFIDAYRNLSKFQQRSSFKTWLIKIMLNNCFRKQQKFSYKKEEVCEIKEESIPMFTLVNQGNTNHQIMNKELNNIIENAIQKVPSDYRIVFSLREINGLSIKETAETLNISESNVKVRLNRAKAMLRKEVEKYYTTEDIFEFNLVYCNKMVKNVMAKLSVLYQSN